MCIKWNGEILCEFVRVSLVIEKWRKDEEFLVAVVVNYGCGYSGVNFAREKEESCGVYIVLIAHVNGCNYFGVKMVVVC